MNLPIGLFVAPKRTLLVENPFPPALISWAGWGGLIGPTDWSDKPAVRMAAIREVIRGVSRHGNLTPGTHRLVVGVEKRSGWTRRFPNEAPAIDNMIRAVYAGLLAIHGPTVMIEDGHGGREAKIVEVAFNGPEHKIAGDFRTPMFGRDPEWDEWWEVQAPMPFISPRYGGTPETTAAMLVRIARTVGLSRGVVLWLQEYSRDEQQRVIDFGVAVDAAAGVLMGQQSGGGGE